MMRASIAPPSSCTTGGSATPPISPHGNSYPYSGCSKLTCASPAVAAGEPMPAAAMVGTISISLWAPEISELSKDPPRLAPDCHGAFFESCGQNYFICNDASQPGTMPYFRDSILSYIRCRKNGEIVAVRPPASSWALSDIGVSAETPALHRSSLSSAADN